MRILLLPGDGIGPEIMRAAEQLLLHLAKHHGLKVELSSAAIGGAAFDLSGSPLPAATLSQAKEADAVLLAAVGGPKWDSCAPENRPEKGLLALRSGLGLFANLRPVRLFPELKEVSSLKPQVIDGLDFVIVRELTGGLYFGKPRGFELIKQIRNRAFNTMTYERSEIVRIAHLAFQIAARRKQKLCSIDKANVLEVSQLWREVVSQIGTEYPEVTLTHMYVDNCAMQLVKAPKQFDVILTENLFGDILSDEASMLSGSIAMLPSACLGESNPPKQKCRGLFEPVHGSAPDIAGKDSANPLAMLLSVALLLRYTHPNVQEGEKLAQQIEAAIATVLQEGFRTADLVTKETPADRVLGTAQMTQILLSHLR